MISSIVEFVKANPIIAVGFSAFVASFWSQLQKLPIGIWQLIKHQAFVSLEVWSEDPISFMPVDRWLSQNTSSQKIRNLTLIRWWDRGSSQDEFALAPGPGFHLIWHNSRLFFVERSVSSAAPSAMNSQKSQTIKIMTYGRNSKLISDLVKSIMDIRNETATVAINIWQSHQYLYLGQRPKRPFSSIYLADSLKTELLRDMESFLSSKEWYADRNIPWHRGYLFSGPPGTGKTSAIMALASLTGKAIYIINPAGIHNDNELLSAVNQAGSNIVVIEDIDSNKEARTRESEQQTQQTTVEAGKQGVTLSGFLNALDGIGVRDDRILICTSNFPDRLDQALIRPGRIDKVLDFGPAGPEVQSDMARAFYPERDLSSWLSEMPSSLPQAELQGHLIGLKETDTGKAAPVSRATKKRVYDTLLYGPK